MSAPAPSETSPGAVGNGSTNLGKRKKPRGKSSYLGTWLERAARHLQEEPDYEYLPHNPYIAPNIDPCRLNGFYPPEPMSLPTYPLYPPAPYPGSCWPQDCRYVQSAHKGVQVQRPRIKRTPNGQQNGPLTNGAFNSAYLQPKQSIEENNEYASLPPIVTSVADTTSNSDVNNDKESGSARRFSDPCLARLPGAVERNASGSEEEGSSYDAAGGNKLLLCLVDQINTLKVTNERLNKDLRETRAELQSIRQQTSLWQKGSTSSLGGPQNHTSLNNNGYVTSGSQYTPGVLTELVREIREAARLREEALYTRVRGLLDERTLNQSVLSSSLDKSSDSRNYEDIKSELRAAEADKRRMNERLSRLENELRQMRNGNGMAEDEECGDAAERLRLRRELGDARRELQDARRAKQLSDENTLKLERLVTQMRSKFNGMHISPGPTSLASEAEAESPGAPPRARRSSGASNSATSTPHTTIVYGPVTDL